MYNFDLSEYHIVNGKYFNITRVLLDHVLILFCTTKLRLEITDFLQLKCYFALYIFSLELHILVGLHA